MKDMTGYNLIRLANDLAAEYTKLVETQRSTGVAVKELVSVKRDIEIVKYELNRRSVQKAS